MAVSDQDLDLAKQKFITNTNILEALVQGLDTADISIGGGKFLPSLAKLQKEILGDYTGVERASGRDVADGHVGMTGNAVNILNAAGDVASFLSTLATAPHVYKLPDAAGILAMKADVDALATLAAHANVYDFHGFVSGKPAASAIVLFAKAGRQFLLPANLVGAQIEAKTAAAASTVFTLLKGATTIGTLTFAAAGTVPTIAFAADVTFAVGDDFFITAPASADANLADVAITILATLV